MTTIEEHVEQLLKTREALRAELESVSAMIAASGVRVQKGAATTPKKKGKTNPNSISERRLDQVFAIVKDLDEPMATADIAKRIPDLSQASVGKALTMLQRSGRIRHAGHVPGVKGKRPMYAPWPSAEETLRNEEPEHEPEPVVEDEGDAAS